MMDSTTAAESGSGGSELCRDLIREILLKLSVKSLVRFKQVSKTWMRMIKSNRFTAEHYRRSAAKNRSSFYVAYCKVSRIYAYRHEYTDIVMGVDVKRDDGHDECRIRENMSMPRFLKYGQGLVTFSEMFPAGFGMYCVWVDWEHRAALWNPATREVKELPRSPFYRHRHFSWRYTFGRVAYEDGAFSYKVGLLELREWPNLELHLYSSSTASWRLITAPRSAFPRNLPCRGVNLKDAVHSLSWDDEAEDYHIVTFDYGRAEFGRIGLPPDAPQLRQYQTQCRALLTLFDDQFLCLVFPWVVHEEEWVRMEGGDVFLDVWVMREYGVEGSWSKECTTGPVSVCMARVRNYSKSVGGIFLESWQREGNRELWLSDIASSAVKKKLPTCSDCRGRIQILERTDSLVRIPRPKHQWCKF